MPITMSGEELYSKLRDINYYDDETDGEEFTLMAQNARDVARLFAGETEQTITQAFIQLPKISLNNSSAKIPRLAKIILNNDALLHKCDSHALNRLLYVEHGIAFEKILIDTTLLRKLDDDTLGKLTEQHGIRVWNRIKEAGLDRLDSNALETAARGHPEIALDILQDNNKIEQVILLLSSYRTSRFHENVEVATALINNPLILPRLEPLRLYNIARAHEDCAKILYDQINTLPQLQELSVREINRLREQYPLFWHQAPIAPQEEYKRAVREEPHFRPQQPVYQPDPRDYNLQAGLDRSFATEQRPPSHSDFTEKNLVDVNEFLKAELLASHGLFNGELVEKHPPKEQLHFVRYLIAKNDSANQEFKEDPAIESKIKELDTHEVMLSIHDAIKKITNKENAPPETIQKIQTEYVRNLRVLEKEIIDSQLKEKLVININKAILGVPKVREKIDFKTIQVTNSNSYLGWMSSLSGSGFFNRFSYWHHGGTGEKRARDLLALANNPESTLVEVQSALKEAYRDSPIREHSLSTYLNNNLSKEQVADLNLSSKNSPQLGK